MPASRAFSPALPALREGAPVMPEDILYRLFRRAALWLLSCPTKCKTTGRFAIAKQPSRFFSVADGRPRTDSSPVPVSACLKVRHPSMTIRIAVHWPLLQSLSETLHAATPRRTSISARSTIRSPARERGGFTAILPSGSIAVRMNRLTGWMIG